MRIDRVECRRILEKAYRCEDLTPEELSIIALYLLDKVNSVLLSESEGILKYKISWKDCGAPCVGKVDMDV